MGNSVFRISVRVQGAEKLNHLSSNLNIGGNGVGSRNIKSPHNSGTEVPGVKCQCFLEVLYVDSDVIKFFYHSCILLFFIFISGLPINYNWMIMTVDLFSCQKKNKKMYKIY